MQAQKLKHQLLYEQKRNLKADVEAAKAELQKVQDNLDRLQGQADTAAKNSAALEDELSAEVSTFSHFPYGSHALNLNGAGLTHTPD